MDKMIEVSNLSRTFGDITAVKDLSFSVRTGEVLGFLGPNGAGKSTTMKMLSCFLTPTSGTAKVGGFDVETEAREVREILGYLPENAPLYGEMEVEDFLRFVGEVRGLEGANLDAAISKAIEKTNLLEVKKQKIETLSKGFKRRVGLAQAILHDPKVLILDEPTDGLDPNQKHEVRDLIRSMAKDKCIIISTHILEEVDSVCTRAMIIAHGQLVADGTPSELRAKAKADSTVDLHVKADTQDRVISLLQSHQGIDGVENLGAGQLRVKSKLTKPELVKDVLATLSKENIELTDFHFDTGQLDQVFRDLTQGK